jgi:hypothetical protein
MRTSLLVGLAALALALAGPAAAWEGVTVHLSAPPDQARAGATWVATLEVLNPEGKPFSVPTMSPGVTIRSSDGARRTFIARETTRAGVFSVRIVFPEAGSWRYRAEAAVGQLGAPAHFYGPVRVGARSSTFPIERSAGAAAAALLLGAAGFAAVKRRRRRSG